MAMISCMAYGYSSVIYIVLPIEERNINLKFDKFLIKYNYNFFLKNKLDTPYL